MLAGAENGRCWRVNKVLWGTIHYLCTDTVYGVTDTSRCVNSSTGLNSSSIDTAKRKNCVAVVDSDHACMTETKRTSITGIHARMHTQAKQSKANKKPRGACQTTNNASNASSRLYRI